MRAWIDERVATCRGNGRDETLHELVGVVVVDAEPGFHRHRHGDRRAHRGDAVRDSRRVEHQRRAEACGLHAVARATDVQVDLVVARALTEPRRRGELVRLAPSELQRDGPFGRVEAQQTRGVTVQQRARRDHLRVETRVRREDAHQEPEVPVRPIHHRRDAEAMR